MHTKPKVFINDISVSTELEDNNDGIINYIINVSGFEQPDESFTCHVTLFDCDNQHTISGPYPGLTGTLKIKSPKLWWPRSMNENPGYLYTLTVITKYNYT